MSFRQDRSNPSTAVSNWKGRSQTPKAHPSTRVNQWLNGGLFGGSSVDTWFSIYSFDSNWSASYGIGNPTACQPWENAKNTPLDGDGNVIMAAETGNSQYVYYRITPSGEIVANAAKIGQYTITNGQWQRYSGNTTTDGSDLLLQGGSGKYSPNSNFQLLPGLIVSPLSDTNTSGTPTIEDFENYDINGSSWNQDRFRVINVYNDDRSSSNTLYWAMGGKPTGYTGWMFGTYNTSSNSIVCTGAARTTNSDWTGSEISMVKQGSSGRMYGFGRGYNGRPSVLMSDATSQGSSNAFQKMRSQAWQKNVNYTAGGDCYGAYSLGTYSGQDQFMVLYSVSHMYGGYDTYIAKMTPYNGNVQANRIIYANNGQGSMVPSEYMSANCMVMDSSDNVYITMLRDGFNNTKEIVVMKLDSSLTVQWTRVMQMTTSNTWGTTTSGQVLLYPYGLNLTADEQFLMVHGQSEYYPAAGQYRKGFSFKVKADGSGAMANSGDAHKVGSGGLTPTVSNSYNYFSDFFVRYYDPSDTSASPTPRPVNNSSLSGNWGSATTNGTTSSNYYGTQSAANKPTVNVLSNVSSYYGNYVYENTFD